MVNPTCDIILTKAKDCGMLLPLSLPPQDF